MALNFDDRTVPVVGHLAILAGGKGTRLAAVAGDVLEVLVPVGGKPVLAHQLRASRGHGDTRGDPSCRPSTQSGPTPSSAMARGSASPCAYGGQEPFGSAGALLTSWIFCPSISCSCAATFMLAVDLQRMARRHFERGADLTALAHPNDHPHDSDLIETDADDWVTAVHAYPHPPDAFFGNLVNASLHAVRRDALRPFAGDRAQARLRQGRHAGASLRRAAAFLPIVRENTSRTWGRPTGCAPWKPTGRPGAFAASRPHIAIPRFSSTATAP